MRFRAAPVAVAAVVGERLAVFQGGHLGFVDRPQGHPGHVRDAADVGSEPAAAEVIFQKAVDAIEVAAERAAGDHQVRSRRADHVTLVAQLCEVDSRADAAAMAARAQQDLMGGCFPTVADDGQLGGGDLLEESPQLLGRIAGRGRGVGRDDDAEVRLASVGQDEVGRMDGGSQGTDKEKASHTR